MKTYTYIHMHIERERESCCRAHASFSSYLCMHVEKDVYTHTRYHVHVGSYGMACFPRQAFLRVGDGNWYNQDPARFKTLNPETLLGRSSIIRLAGFVWLRDLS